MQNTNDKTHGRRRSLQTLLALASPAWMAGAPARALAAEPTGPLRLACDAELVACGLVPAWVRGFAADTGLRVVPQPAAPAEALDRALAGAVDILLLASPERSAPAVQQGLLHDPRPAAVLRWRLMGPTSQAGGGAVSAAAASTDALGRLQALALMPEAERRFLAPAGPGATADLLESLWRAAGLDPDVPWRRPADPGTPLAEQARAGAAHALVGEWMPVARPPRGAPGWGPVADHDPRLRSTVLSLRPFQVRHPAARLWADWIAGPPGRRVARRLPGLYLP